MPSLTATATLVILLALRPLSTSRAVAIWVVLVAGMTLFLIVEHARDGRRTRSRFESALRRRPAAMPQPIELLRVERELELGIASAGNAHRRLLPMLREAAAARLASHHGVELERRPEAARLLLGDEVWELVRPDRPKPSDRFDPGIPRHQVVAAVERLELL